MKNFFLLTPEELIEEARIESSISSNLDTSQSNILNQNNSILTTSWDEDEEEEEEREVELTEIDLYDFTKTYDENFESSSGKKYILYEVDEFRTMRVADPAFSLLPTPQSKCLVDFMKAEEYSSLEFTTVDYDTIFGTRFTTFMKYNSKFFMCDERVMFEVFLIKLKGFGYRPFYWSKEMMFKETGIKKDRATKIISRFVDLGIISIEVKKSMISNRPHQITYFTLNAENIYNLLPQIFEGRDEMQIVENDLKKYLGPIFKSSNPNILQ